LEYDKQLNALKEEIQTKKEIITNNELILTQLEKKIIQKENLNETLTQLKQKCEELQITIEQTQQEISVQYYIKHTHIHIIFRFFFSLSF
jgi:SMC interacting uncharacterized protein involved in chromosome segregation